MRVNSRLIDEVYFSSRDKILQVYLMDGEKRTFKDVPESIVNEMISASSPGQYYLDHIRRKFQRRVF